MERVYIGPYKVYKVFRISRRREVLARGLSMDQATRMVERYPDSSRSMVVKEKQFSQDKYFLTVEQIKKKLEYFRQELRAERISQGELIELEFFAKYIDEGDVELLEAAGVPEKH